MSWIFGTASDHRDFSDKLAAAATGTSLASVDSVAAGGTGYTVGDILTLSGGTATIAAQVEVTAVSSGVVTAVRRYNDGVYSAAPTDPVATTGGTGSGCTLNCTFAANGWTALRNTTLGLASVDSVAAGGTGYTVGMLITLSGGTTTHPAIVQVATVSGGAVTGVTIYDAGSYSATPTDPVAQAVVQPTGGAGATFNVTWTAAAGTREVILQGSGGGTDEIVVGWRTLQSVAGDYYNLELHGFAGYVAANGFTEQPNISDGQYDADVPTARAGAYLISYPVEHAYYLKITPYQIIIVTQLTGRCFNAYLGWGNRYGTAAEYPYPMVVSGCTSLFSMPYSTSQQVSGLTDPWRSTASDGSNTGPMLVYLTDGTWYGVHNSTVAAGSRTQAQDRVVVPCGKPYGTVIAEQKDRFVISSFDFSNIIPQTGLSTVAAANAYPVGSENNRILLPNSVVFSLPSAQIVLELADVYWVSGYGGVASGDRVIVAGEVYRVFQNCNRTDLYAYLAIKEG